MKETITIIGPGAVGLEFAILLHKKGHRVTLVGRSESDRLNDILTNGATLKPFKVKEDEAAIIVPPGAIFSGTPPVPEGKMHVVSDTRGIITPQQYAIIAIKLCDFTAEFVETTLAPLVRANPAITLVFAANGIQPGWLTDEHGKPLESVDPGSEIVRQLETLGNPHIVPMIVRRTNYRLPNGVVENANRPGIFPPSEIGEINPATPIANETAILATIFTDAGLPVKTTDNILNALFIKLMLNITGVFCAITGNNNGETLADPNIKKAMRYAVQEAITVCFEPEDRPNVDAIIAIATKFPNYRPSILTDVEGLRPTEYKAIVAAVAELGSKAITPYPCPALDFMADYMQSLEAVYLRQPPGMTDDEKKQAIVNFRTNNLANFINSVISAAETTAPEVGLGLMGGAGGGSDMYGVRGGAGGGALRMPRSRSGHHLSAGPHPASLEPQQGAVVDHTAQYPLVQAISDAYATQTAAYHATIHALLNSGSSRPPRLGAVTSDLSRAVDTTNEEIDGVTVSNNGQRIKIILSSTTTHRRALKDAATAMSDNGADVNLERDVLRFTKLNPTHLEDLQRVLSSCNPALTIPVARKGSDLEGGSDHSSAPSRQPSPTTPPSPRHEASAFPTARGGFSTKVPGSDKSPPSPLARIGGAGGPISATGLG